MIMGCNFGSCLMSFCLMWNQQKVHRARMFHTIILLLRLQCTFFLLTRNMPSKTLRNSVWRVPPKLSLIKVGYWTHQHCSHMPSCTTNRSDKSHSCTNWLTVHRSIHFLRRFPGERKKVNKDCFHKSWTFDDFTCGLSRMLTNSCENIQNVQDCRGCWTTDFKYVS